MVSTRSQSRPLGQENTSDHLRARRGKESSIFPPEVLACIIEAAACDDDFPRKTLLRCSLACKTWLPVARRLLYREITVVESDEALLLYATISASPDLGALIRVLNTSDIFHLLNGSAILRFLDLTPNICELGLDIAQIPLVCKHPRWHQISCLRVLGDEFNFLVPESNMWPSKLKTLIFEGENSLLNGTVNWTRLRLPEVETLIFDKSTIHVEDPSEATILPNLPKLQRIKILDPHRRTNCPLEAPELLEALEVFKRIFYEASDRLRHLDIDMSDHWPAHLFTASALSPLKQLETLKYEGRIHDSEADLARTLPSSLQNLTIMYIGSPSLDTAAKLVTSIAKSTFLPRLACCPSVTLLYRTPDEVSESVSQAPPVLELARSATSALLDRPGMLPAEELAHNYLSQYALHLLPSS